MSVQRTVEHYKESLFFRRHPDFYVAEAEESIWLTEHDHSFVEVVLVIEGKGTQYLNGIPVHVQAGDVFAIPVGTRHIFRPSPRSAAPGHERLKVWNCLLTQTSLRKLEVFLDDEGSTRFLKWLNGEASDNGTGKDWLYVKDRTGELRQRFRRLSSLHAKNPASAEPMALWSEILGLLSAVYRETPWHRENESETGKERPAKESASPSPQHSSSLPNEAGDMLLSEGRFPSANPPNGYSPLQLAMAYMIRRYATPITLEEAAAAAGIGGRQLSRLFASRTGRTFKEHLIELRIDACCRLLAEGKIPIMDIPPLVGYEQWKSLSRVFRKRMGVSMSEYKKQE